MASFTTRHTTHFSAPLTGVNRGRLVFAPGASRIRLRVDPEMSELVRARFEGDAPDVEVNGGEVTIRYRHSGLLGAFFFGWRDQTEGDLALNPAVPWEIETRGGANRVEADLTGLRLEALRFGGGANRIELALPRPGGDVRIRCSGGANRLTVRRPVDAPFRLEIEGGANRIVFDGQETSTGRKSRFQSNGYETASDRYTFEIAGGANRVNVEAVGVEAESLPFL